MVLIDNKGTSQGTCRPLLLALALAALFDSTPAAAQSTLERVEVTGSSLLRVGAQTHVPVTIIRVADLLREGVTSTEEALTHVTQNQSAIGIGRSVGFSTGAKSEVDLRGLSAPMGRNADKTLVLLNGRRLAAHAFDSAAVDLHAIPLAAVDRIEILRDGASPIYGTDAVGGVVNFILKDRFSGIELSADAQQAGQGGGAVRRFSLTGGTGSLAEDGYTIFGALDHRRQRALSASQRSFSATGVLDGRITDGTSGFSFPGDLDGYEPSLPACAPPASVPDETGGSCRYDYSRDVDNLPSQELSTGLLRGSVRLAPGLRLNAEYLRARSEATTRIAPAPGYHWLPASSPYFPAGAASYAIPDLSSGDPDATVPGGLVAWRMVPAGPRTNHHLSTADRALLELQGELESSWDYRAAVGRSVSRSTESVRRGHVDDGLIQAGLWNGSINPFGAQSAAGQAAIEAAQVVAPVQRGESRLDFIDARLAGDLAMLPAGPLSLAVGVEHRREQAGFETLDIAGQLAGLGLDPDGDTRGSRHSNALFAELGVPLTRSLDLTVAARHDRYSDFGSTFNPKLGLRFQPSAQWLLRGSLATGFRAPSLYDLHQPQSLTYTAGSYDDPLLCAGGTPVDGASASVVCGQQVMSRIGGPGASGGSLQPEKSTTVSFGTVIEPVERLTLGIDYWNVKVRNLIGGLPDQAIFADSARYAGRLVRCSQLPASGSGVTRSDFGVCANYPGFDPIAYVDQQTQNLGELHTSGFDVSGLWRLAPSALGRLAIGLEGTYVLSYKYQREAGGEFISAAGRYSDHAPIFRWQHTLSAHWGAGPWALTLAQRFKSGYQDQEPTHRVGSYSLYDLSASWSGLKDLVVAVGVKNLLDTDPPRTYQLSTYQYGYDSRYTDPLGRTWTLRMNYRF